MILMTPSWRFDTVYNPIAPAQDRKRAPLRPMPLTLNVSVLCPLNLLLTTNSALIDCNCNQALADEADAICEK